MRGGDYVLARRLLEDVPEEDRAEADRLAAATRLDPGTLWVGLGCVGLLLLVILIAALKQP